MIESFKEYLTSKYNEYLGGINVRTNDNNKITKEQFVFVELSEVANTIKNVNEMNNFENYLDLVLPDINLIISNFNSSNLSMDETIYVIKTY